MLILNVVIQGRDVDYLIITSGRSTLFYFVIYIEGDYIRTVEIAGRSALVRVSRVASAYLTVEVAGRSALVRVSRVAGAYLTV